MGKAHVAIERDWRDVGGGASPQRCLWNALTRDVTSQHSDRDGATCWTDHQTTEGMQRKDKNSKTKATVLFVL